MKHRINAIDIKEQTTNTLSPPKIKKDRNDIYTLAHRFKEDYDCTIVFTYKLIGAFPNPDFDW